MNLNHHQVQQLMVLSDLMDVLRNPKEVKDMIKELQKSTKEHVDVIEKQRQISDVDSWYRDLKKEHTKDVVALLAERKVFEDKTQKWMDACTKRSLAYDKASEELHADHAAVLETKKQLRQVDSATKELKVRVKELNVLEESVELKQKELHEKLLKFDALLGGKV